MLNEYRKTLLTSLNLNRLSILPFTQTCFRPWQYTTLGAANVMLTLTTRQSVSQGASIVLSRTWESLGKKYMWKRSEQGDSTTRRGEIGADNGQERTRAYERHAGSTTTTWDGPMLGPPLTTLVSRIFLFSAVSKQEVKATVSRVPLVTLAKRNYRTRISLCIAGYCTLTPF